MIKKEMFYVRLPLFVENIFLTHMRNMRNERHAYDTGMSVFSRKYEFKMPLILLRGFCIFLTL